MWPKEVLSLLKKLNIRYPIIQAPMAGGATTIELVSTVSNTGGLGSVGAAYLTSENIRTTIKHLRKCTNQPFSVNLFIPQLIKDQDLEKENKNLKKMTLLLDNYSRQIGYPKSTLDLNIDTEHKKQEKIFQEQITILLEEEVPIVSFTFGIPPLSIIQSLKEKNTIVMGTATTVKEGILLAQVGCDMIVAQGSEAGGHRGTFQEENYNTSLISIKTLVPQMIEHVDRPIIAAGGIMNGKDLVSLLDLGASGVQMGTAFLTCKESGIHPLYKKAILSNKGTNTVITRVFSGKPARGIKNKFIEDFEKEKDIPAFPLQHELTKGLRKTAAQNNDINYMSLWAGEGRPLNKIEISANQLIENIISEIHKIYHTIS